MNRTGTIILFLLLACGAARSQDSIIRARTNPGPVRLNEVWRIAGDALNGPWNIGFACEGVSDVNGDSIMDFAVRSAGRGWEFFYGASPAPSVEPVLRLGSWGSLRFVVGDFWGTGHKAIGIARDSCDQFSRCFFGLSIFRTDAGYIDTTSAAAYLAIPEQFCKDVCLAADLDGDGADELIVSGSCYRKEIWIYKGGANFQVDTPTLTITDPDIGVVSNDMTNNLFRIVVGDFDGDHRVDMITANASTSVPPKDSARLKFYFSSESSPWSWSEPDRVITLDSRHQVRIPLTVLDCDGDSVLDILAPGRPNPHLFRTYRTGKNTRTRSFLPDDADAVFSYVTPASPVRLGYLNDSSGRYETFGLTYGFGILVFSGGPNGPDRAYDATYDDGIDSPFGYVRPTGDVTGDGWEDFIASNPNWFEPYHAGIAIVLAGGAYIPRDDTTLTIRDVALEGKERALTLWPNPVCDELNIAWRGDLVRAPRSFEVHDAAGRRVAAGDIEQGASAALWRCAHVPAGTYFLGVRDSRGALLAVERIVKE